MYLVSCMMCGLISVNDQWLYVVKYLALRESRTLLAERFGRRQANIDVLYDKLAYKAYYYSIHNLLSIIYKMKYDYTYIICY